MKPTGSRIAAALDNSLARLHDAWRWARGEELPAPAGAQTFRYGKDALVFLQVISVVTVVEIIVVELVVSWLWLRILLAGLAVASLPLMAGMVAAQRIRPHILTEHSLLLRAGEKLEAELPLSGIAFVSGVLASAPKQPGQVGSTLWLTPTGSANVLISLHPDQSAKPDSEAALTEIRCTADHPDQLVAAIRAAIALAAAGRGRPAG